MTLGSHDEFTLFAAVALTNMFDDSSTALWDLAKRVDGWGRIQVVERLVPTDDPKIQRWLRTEGFRNAVYEYLAHTAAVHGKLKEGLEARNVSADELTAASEIISALISGNGAPAEGIDAYDDAAEACPPAAAGSQGRLRGERVVRMAESERGRILEVRGQRFRSRAAHRRAQGPPSQAGVCSRQWSTIRPTASGLARRLRGSTNL